MRALRRPDAPSARAPLAAPAAALAALLVIAAFTWRCLPRLRDPAVWGEDGLDILPAVLRDGAGTILEPLNGYLVVVPKLLTVLASSLTLAAYPAASTLLAWAVSVAVLAIVATAPTRLRGGWLLAAAVAWVPADTEVFAAPLYAFWWTSLLLPVVALWDERRPGWIGRATMVALASLSSPLCIATLPLFWWRMHAFPGRPAERRVAAVATACAALQLALILRGTLDGSSPTATAPLDAGAPWAVLQKFVGAWMLGRLGPAWSGLAGVALAAGLALAFVRARRDPRAWVLAWTALAAVALTLVRVDVHLIDPAHTAPRYFFVPYVLLAWAVLQIAIEARGAAVRAGAVAALGLAALGTPSVAQRHHDPLDWARHVASCADFDTYLLPVHTDGDASRRWAAAVDGATCARRAARDPFAAPSALPHHAHRLVDPAPARVEVPTFARAAALVASPDVPRGADYFSVVSGTPSFPGARIVGSFVGSDDDTGSWRIVLARGDRLWWRSGAGARRQRIEVVGATDRFVAEMPPAPEWTVLEFSSARLPDRFELRLVDDGRGPGEWSAVALLP